MAHIISIIQTKGGTGKTTTTMMLGFALSSLGDRVLVLDADKQRSASDWAAAVEKDMPFPTISTPTDRTLKTTVNRSNNDDYDFILIDTPPGSNSIVESASTCADLVLIPSGVSPLDMERTQATLDSFEGTETPIAVVLVNVDKREKLLTKAQASLTAHTRAALADTIIPTRSATRRVGYTIPNITTKPLQEWLDLAKELKEAF
ncbi:ParA family protein [Corynebacterium callunae]|nr:ParA family protein [Corynebacterium callunae]